MNCNNCLHNIVCDLWRKEECQDASNITDPLGDSGCGCFEPLNRRRGIWKTRGAFEDMATMYDCPVCDNISSVVGDPPNFCPKCGAKMVE